MEPRELKKMRRMTSEMIEEAVIWLGFLGIFFLILTVGGMIADYMLPRIPFIGRFFDSLPEREDDAEIARRYERIQRQKATRRRK